MDSTIRAAFREMSGKTPLVASAPGRVNLIGEHTDYNQGFVLPGAIDKKVQVALAANGSGFLNLYAIQYGERLRIPMDDIRPRAGWSTYFLGMIHYLQPPGKPFGGLDVLVDGKVPLGAGMSSSAAICSAFGFALNELFHLGLSRMELALAGQQTEHHFAGVQCGIMDQFASLHGKAGHLMKLDCRSLDYEYIPFDYPEHRIVLVNTMVSHSLAGSEYNVRRKQCEEGVKIMQKHYPGIHSLRDVDLEQLEEHRREMSPVVFRRCAFVLRENQRLLEGCGHLQKGDLSSFGRLMFAAHEDLSKGYEVSCAESDFLVEEAAKQDGVLGARQMGGGFGGCTINIVSEASVDGFISYIRERYHSKFGRLPETYITQIEDGAKILPG